MLERFIKALSAIVEGLNMYFTSLNPDSKGYFLTKVSQVPQKIGVLKVLDVELWFLSNKGKQVKVFSFSHTGKASNDTEYITYLKGAITLFIANLLALITSEEFSKYD